MVFTSQVHSENSSVKYSDLIPLKFFLPSGTVTGKLDTCQIGELRVSPKSEAGTRSAESWSLHLPA